MSLLGKSVGNYRITAQLGEGGMGMVYLGEHPLIGKKVAIKVLHEELAAKEDIVARFFTEAKAVNDIGHQNIVDIVDFGKLTDEHGRDLVYFVMEFLEGDALASRLEKKGVSFGDTLHVMAQCCSALSASHKKGIVHRDLKPENIFLVTRGNDRNFIKVLDFGIAKLTGDAGSSSKTRTGSVIGTPAYMSPEQCEGRGHIDHRSDVYSLGVVMFELLTGRVPFQGEGFGEILVAQITQQAPRPSSINPQVPAELEAIVLHALEKDRNRRFQSMDEFAAAIADPAGHLARWQQLPVASPASSSHSGRTLFLDENAPPPPLQPTVTRTGQGQPPTTLSGAAAEMQSRAMAQAPRRGRGPVIVISAAAVLVVAGVVGVVVLRRPAETPTVQAATTPPADETIIISIASDPPGAKVTGAVQGELGTTPLKLPLKKTAGAFDVRVTLDGYKPAILPVRPDGPAALQVSLAKKEELPPPPVVQLPTEPEPKAATSKAAAPKTEHHHSKKPAKSDDGELLKPSFLN